MKAYFERLLVVNGANKWVVVKHSEKCAPISNIPQAFTKILEIRFNQVLVSSTRFNAQMVQVLAKLTNNANHESTTGILGGICSDDQGKMEYIF